MEENGPRTEEIFSCLFISFKKKITIKTFSRKIYTIIKKSLQKFVNEKITIKLPNDLLIRGSKGLWYIARK